MSYNDSRENQFISKSTGPSDHFANNNIIEGFYDGNENNLITYQAAGEIKTFDGKNPPVMNNGSVTCDTYCGNDPNKPPHPGKSGFPPWPTTVGSKCVSARLQTDSPNDQSIDNCNKKYGKNVVCQCQDDIQQKFIIGNENKIIKNIKNQDFKENFTNPKVKGNQKERKVVTRNNTNKIETFANYPYGNPSNGTATTTKGLANSGNPIYTVVNTSADLAKEGAKKWCENSTDNSIRCGAIIVSDNYNGTFSAKVYENINGTTAQDDGKNPNSIIYNTADVDPIKTITSEDGTLGRTLNDPLPGRNSGNYEAIVDGESHTVQIDQSEYNKERLPLRNASWSADTTLIPDDLNYRNPQGSESKAILPLPEQCHGQDLDPYQPTKIVDESNDEDHYIYVDGRKMKLSDESKKNDNCYAAKYWMDPKNKSSCGTEGGGEQCGNISGESKKVSTDCFLAIPTVEGNNPSDPGAIECQSDIRPSQRAGIANDLLAESNKYSTRGRKAALLYNTKSAIVASKYGEIEKANGLISNQMDNSKANTTKLEKIDNSIYSQQRQVQISNDETRRRDENLFLLKILLTYLLIISIPLIIKRGYKDQFSNLHLTLVVVFISLPFIYILSRNLYSIRNRSPMRWPLRNWADGKIPASEDGPPEIIKPTCQPDQEDPQCQEEALALEEEIKDLDRQKRAKWKDANSLLEKERALGKQLCNLPEQCSTGSLCKKGINLGYT